ncbi:hypothetical protein [Bradyrhizobium liaoningense]|uniref:hypothetical protein n=1 Tax=Bradyrhizobium liaoningense TaxID=43992 RepID=UPI001BA6502A|nr:hypothetical protein [Bradyrhizobium liaoningense]MBR0906876.1 hypothetical protein [Bradyrhizobium liaoningense]
MNTKRSVLAACTILTLSAGVAVAGPCNTGSAGTDKDAGSGPVTVGSAQPQSSSSETGQHPPTSTMNRASSGAAASSEDAQRQMQSQPTAADSAGGAKPNTQTAGKDC